jgi:hypothetical protein
MTRQSGGVGGAAASLQGRVQRLSRGVPVESRGEALVTSLTRPIRELPTSSVSAEDLTRCGSTTPPTLDTP